MTLDLPGIGALIALAVAYALLCPPRLRGWLLYAASIALMFVFQPLLPIRFSDFALPAAALTLTVAAWWFTRPPDAPPTNRRENIIALIVALAVLFAMAANRYLPLEARITPSRPPDALHVALMLALGALVALGITPLLRRAPRRTLTGLIALIVALFAVIKTPPLAEAVAGAWRAGTGQDAALASLIDLNWLGFSYIAFRLIHTLRDRQTGLLPALTLREYVTYVVFFPAYIAGPIDRAERFAADLRALPGLRGLDAARWQSGLTRIAMGLFKKFVIADTLAQGMALDARLAGLSDSPLHTWALVYGYALRLFFDFSGYSDIAIGLGLLFGIRLPENFDRPYLKTNLTAFWQSWHMTLSGWARFYIFTPLSRALLMREPKPSTTLIVLSAHLTTMIVIGLWHGVTWNFLIWGVWHALGLFVHKQWSDRTRKWFRALKDRPARKRAWTFFAWALTFHYVLLGWVWFALPDVPAALRTFGLMFGVIPS
jgi:alginate O-acetyltransferase complex protein AlgI